VAHILVVDDEAPLRSVLRRGLERHGHTVSEASEGAEALRLCRKTVVNLVLLDIFMPGKEGIETIRELHRDLPGLKIIAMSGGGRYGYVDVLETAQKLGAQRIFRKSDPWEELLAIVSGLLAEDEKGRDGGQPTGARQATR
jgi:CheY-like chemotaxis protein